MLLDRVRRWFRHVHFVALEDVVGAILDLLDGVRDREGATGARDVMRK